MLWIKETPITKVCQKAWYIRIRPWKSKHGSVQGRLAGVSLEKTSQSLSFSFAQLPFIKTIYQKRIKRAWGQLCAYSWLFATVIEKEWIANQVPEEAFPECVIFTISVCVIFAEYFY